MNCAFWDEDFWTNFCSTYQKSKDYLLLIEEIDEESDTVMQPVKEQRDALDHIVRAYQRYQKIVATTEQGGDEEQLRFEFQEELDKAKGHIDRALFDCYDIYSIILRHQISAYLSTFSYRAIESVWPDYRETRKYLLTINKRIAKLRNRTPDDAFPTDQKNTEYEEIISKIEEIHDKVLFEIYPQLSK